MAEFIAQCEIDAQKDIMNLIKSKNNGENKLACVHTLGCVQNENDSERIRGMLLEMGYTMCEEEKKADVVIFNTCAVRENAELKVFGFIGALKNVKAKRPRMIIGICGCMMQQQYVVDKIKKTYKHVDMIFGTHTIHRFPKILHSAMQQKTVDVEDSEGYIAENIHHLRGSSVVASVSIMYGCNNFCTYCIVPYVRGRERSRRPADILAEVEGLALQGYKEVTLIGQNVNSYVGYDDIADFADLIESISKIEGIERIRFVSSHPKDFSDKLIDTIAGNKKICIQIHLPFQAGSNKVLKDMNRKYTKEQYLSLIERIKTKIPNVALSSDIIVGFPTETNEDFADTVDVVKKIGFDMLYTFIYSRRSGTPAAEINPVLTEDEIKHNFEELLKVQSKIVYDINAKLQGSVVSVLVEGESKTNPNLLTGRTESGKIVNFSADRATIGTIIDVKITHVATWSLTGEIYK